MIPLLPKWCLTNKLPAFYDMESATAIEQTAKLYGAMQGMIDDYNKFVDEFNKTFEEYVNGLNQDHECFQNSINKLVHDYIAMLDEKIKQQDKVIADAVLYMKDNITTSITNIITQMKEMGELDQAVLDAIDGIGTRVTSLETKSAELEEVDNSLDTRATNLETRATNLETRATELEEVDNSLDTRATALETKSAELEEVDNSLDTRATNLETRATNLETRATNLETGIEKLEEISLYSDATGSAEAISLSSEIENFKEVEVKSYVVYNETKVFSTTGKIPVSSAGRIHLNNQFIGANNQLDVYCKRISIQGNSLTVNSDRQNTIIPGTITGTEGTYTYITDVIGYK